MSVHLTLSRRHLLHVESLLGELDSALAREALLHVHTARLNIETLQRLEDRPHAVHVTGSREAA